MRGRVAIRKLEPVTTAALATAAAGTVGRVVAGKAAKGAAKTAAKQTFVDKVKDSAAQQAGKNLANAPKNLAESAGEKAAEQNRQAQASMEQRGQQMAEKAKHGSQITTGEPMDMSWQLLKAWSWAGGFEGLDKKSIIEHAKKTKTHVGNRDIGHYHDRFNKRYKQGQEMPKGAEGLTPHDLAMAYLDLILQKHPDLLSQMNEKQRAPNNTDPDNFPGLTFPLLTTDEPIESQVESDRGEMHTGYHPVFAVGHDHNEKFDDPKAHIVTVAGRNIGAGNRQTIPVTHVSNLFSHEHYPLFTEEEYHLDYSGDSPPLGQRQGISQQQRNKNILQSQADKRHFEGDFMQPIDFEEMQAQGLGRSMKPADAEQRVQALSPYADDFTNPLIAMPESKVRRDYERHLAQQQSLQEEEEKEKEVQAPTPLGGGMYVWQGNYYGGLGQPPLPPEASALIQTGEPMNLAWRMLKGELQLPHQISSALHDDIMTLDRQHKMTDTNEGTLIENIHPDMENVVKLLADKDFEDLPKTVKRPTVPLFHGQFH
jgi:hypothetical protein